MTNSEAIEIIKKFQALLTKYQVPIEKMTIDDTNQMLNKLTLLSHIHWMLYVLECEFKHDRLDCDKKEQVCARLGFIQGILLAFHLCTVHEEGIKSIIEIKK